MSIQGRIEELTNRHTKLDEKIHDETKRPTADSLRLQELKRRKLHIKEELQELQRTG